ncbi:MAG: topoisomerase DNA-binding C4 zinc finger domain-containing protein [Oscillospiraceae bacterium]|nr:topoisomerase DNA-binding C4 zinc finger domain-containing protein [Oscillospiraceae bacterium]
MDRFEVRWAQCTACGEIKPGVEFKRYGANEAEGCLGLCKDCFDAGRSEWSLIPKPEQICPRCGSRLKPMNGPYGEFWGCSNYPNCKYSKRK